MSQQGETPTGRRDEDAYEDAYEAAYEDDWWGQLYDDTAGDTGPAAAPDSLDDRFASVAGTVGGQAPADGPGVPAPRPEPGAQAPSAPPAGAAWGGFPPSAATGPRDGEGPEPARGAAGEPEDTRPPSDPARAGSGTGSGRGDGTEPRGRGDATREAAPERESAPGRGAGAEWGAGPVGDTASDRDLGPGWEAGFERTSDLERGERPERGPGALRDTAPEPAAGPEPNAGSGWDPAPGREVGGEPPGGGDAVPSGGEAVSSGGDAVSSGGGDAVPSSRAEAVPPSRAAGAVAVPRDGHGGAGAEGGEGRAGGWFGAGVAGARRDGRTGADATAGGRSGDGDEDAAPPPDRETVDLFGGRGGGAVTYVGEEPPSYDPEPTSLPMADPAALEDLVPDTVLDGARYGALTLRAASVRGDSARYRGEVRRDALLTARFGVGDRALVLVAQATGARATPEGQRAAAAACRWVGQAVGRSAARLAEDIRESRGADLRAGLQRLTDRTLGRLRAAAAEEGRDPAVDEASLRCLLLPADPDCRTRVFFGVGDGGLLRLRDGAWEDLEPRPAAAPGAKPAELTLDLGIATPPSPYRPAPEPPREPFRFRTCVARPGDRLLMCGAGLAEPLAGEPALLAHLGRRWSAPEPPGVADFLTDVRVRVKGYADDRTAVAVWEA
ncbi:protein phosphatase 2C domain-containing protein [Streptomyces sp. NPDC002644]